MTTRGYLASPHAILFALLLAVLCASSPVAPATMAAQFEPLEHGPRPGVQWRIDDLLSGTETVLAPVRARALELRRVPQHPGLRGHGGTMDIGEIAVLENDGTLVDPNNLTDIIAISNRFYETHSDEYDVLVAFAASTFPGDVQPEAGFAFYLPLAGFVAGINDFARGNPNEAGGLTRLQGLVNMNDLPEYPADPTTDFLGIVASGVEILGQEFGHAYGSFVQADVGDILGRGEAHWSFFLHTPGVGNASPLEGNRWQDNGDGSFTTLESFTGFSELDEYLLGIRPPGSVAPFYLVVDPNGNPPFNDSAFPSEGITVNGQRTNMTVQNIINVEGVRLPDTTTSQKTFKVAFVLVIPEGTNADAGDLAKLNTFRQAWETYFFDETEGLGTMDTSLGAGPVTALPFADNFDAAVPDINDWSWNQGCTISSLGIGEPSGDSALRLNGNWGGGDEIRSRVIDLSAFASGQVTINYHVQRTGAADSPEGGDDLLIEYFSDNGTWVVLRTVTGAGPDQVSFVEFNDVVPDDGLHTAFRLRFHRLQDTIGDVDDFFVDDVSISTAGCPLPGCGADVNGDCVVDLSDLAVVLGNFGQVGGVTLQDGDIDGDDDVDLTDLATLLAQFGTSCL